MQQSGATIKFQSPRLQFAQVQVDDADELFDCISAAVARYMTWEPPRSRSEFRAQIVRAQYGRDHESFSFVVRRRDNDECIGKCAVDDIFAAVPEIGLWIKEDSQALGYGTEIVRALVGWASEYLGKTAFMYPVALQNIASRRIAEKLGGTSVGARTGAKYESEIYQIPSDK